MILSFFACSVADISSDWCLTEEAENKVSLRLLLLLGVYAGNRIPCSPFEVPVFEYRNDYSLGM